MLVNICWMCDKCQGEKKNTCREQREAKTIFERCSKGCLKEGQHSITGRGPTGRGGLMTSRSHWLLRKLWFLPAQGLLWHSWLSLEDTGTIPHVWACWSRLYWICELQQEIFNSREHMRGQFPAGSKMGMGVTWTLPKWAPGLHKEAREN